MSRVDLNCDLGEGGADDEALMEWVTSVNVACGGHAGDRASMLRTVRWAADRGVAVGAHPGYEDRESFGRKELHLSVSAIETLVYEQVSRLAEMATVHHVKPHGALYNQSARHPAMAEAIVKAIGRVDRGIVIYGLSGGALVEAGRRAGLAVAHEVFADRAYEPDGSLTPRDQPGAVHLSVETALVQVLQLVSQGEVRSRSGITVRLRADTVCIHSDTPHALEFARELHQALRRAGVRLARVVP
jgi:UPF0271 protein